MSVTHLTDFSDRISPMLVKELRQGLRAKTFIGVFLALQVFLAVMLFSAGASSTSDHVGSVISGIIFSFFAVAVLVVQPLRGIGALSSEVKGNTIDMMVLTRLSSWRIVFGKWVAIVSQSALLLSTIIPYLILRYFFGGMNLIAEMVLLGLLFLTSMGLTAVTVGLSGCHSVIVRSLLPIFGLPILLWTLLVMAFGVGIRGTGLFNALALDSSDSRIGIACYVATVVYIGGTMLSLGASLIAPAAENHTIMRRLVALAAMLLLLTLSAFDKIYSDLLTAMVAIIAIPAIIIALTESAHLVQTVCKPFIKRGRIAACIGWLFYPTWSSGILFTILLGLLGVRAIMYPLFGTTGFMGIPKGYDSDEGIVILAFFGGLIFPAVWQTFLFRGEGQRLGHYLLLLVGSLIMLGVLTGIAESMENSGFLWFFAWNPLSFIAMLNRNPASDSTLLLSVMIIDAILLLILASAAFNGIRKSASVIQQTKASLETAA